MQFFYKIFLGFIVILFIVFGALVVVRGLDNGWVDEEYPVLTDQLIAGLKEGDNTWLFDREQVVLTYASNKFPQKKAKILREKDLDHQYLYAVDIEGMILKIRLQKRKLDNMDLSIWVVAQIQQDV